MVLHMTKHLPMFQSSKQVTSSLVSQRKYLILASPWSSLQCSSTLGHDHFVPKKVTADCQRLWGFDILHKRGNSYEEDTEPVVPDRQRQKPQ
jgi:hypothetical protein